ncbi:MAG: MFS transporter, partial [Promethearchaeota archaeon]
MSRNDYGINPEDNVLVVNRLQDRPRFGLSGNLQRLALVTGIAQFSMSIWVWQFGIFLEANVNQLWQIGLTFSIGTLATIIGYGVAGTIADYFGRKNAMIFAFIPMFVGLVLLRFFPHWPWVPLEYATVQIGWAFIIIMTSAIPADELAKTGGENAARTFNMVLLPAFLVDGLSPVVAGLLLDLGYVAGDLHLLAAIGTIVAMIATRLG